ncbi:mevalonate kinase [Streptomyces sp. ZAF1911]|uniref:mevalonate kinase family protein n=1 Tax=Streptomyces sp. ZAF1911 TaxID=2944129 RepID=UPI00237A1AB7|nr:mevalonate kinase [Streptomyces sp. ZAF1911]MDD9379337.1 mevalonate kinase [Streptomyces sp. ZAF1911]
MTPTNAQTYPDHAAAAGEMGLEEGRIGWGRAHAKAILLGEHAVVYGAPALAIPVPQLSVTATARRLRCSDAGADRISFALAGPGPGAVTPLAADGLRCLLPDFKAITGVDGHVCVDVIIDCAIPQGRGLGSSAACARAAVLALADLFDRRLDAREVFDLVQASEKVAHGRSSGIDALATGATSPLLFRSGAARELPVAMPGYAAARSAAHASAPSPVHSPERTDGGAAEGRPSYAFDGLFVLADSGVSGSTKEAVELLWRKFERSAQTQADFILGASRLTRAAARDLAHGRTSDFGARMTENHKLLHELGLSTDRIDGLVDAALAAGSLGAKISGGGLGGCVIALAAEPRQAEATVRSLHEAGAVRTWVVPMGRFANHDD